MFYQLVEIISIIVDHGLDGVPAVLEREDEEAEEEEQLLLYFLLALVVHLRYLDHYVFQVMLIINKEL